MTVAELIQLLARLPQDRDVVVYNAGDEPICYTAITASERGDEVIIEEARK